MQLQRIGNGQGDLELWDLGSAAGVGKCVRIAAPVNGQPGFAPGCEYVQYFATYAITFKNAGSATSSFWVEADAGPGTGIVFGGSGAAVPSTGAVMLGSGNVYRTIRTTANGISPSATGALKIVDLFTLPANSFDLLGRGLQFSIWCNNTGTSGHAVRIQVVANPSNSGLPSSGAGVAGKTDGTVTVTGGTVILDTGSSYSPTGTVTFGIQLVGQLFKAGAAAANTQESFVQNIFPSAGLTHTAAWADQTLTENAANVFAVVVSAATTAADIVYQGMEISAFN